jgi:outer membrane protein assembly factor BamB
LAPAEGQALADRRLAALHEAGLLWDALDADGERLLRCYDLLGHTLSREVRPGRSAIVAGALARSELWTAEGAKPVDILRGPCAKNEILQHVAAGDWAAVSEASEQLGYWLRPADVRQFGGFVAQSELTQWADWGAYLASRAVGTAPKTTAQSAVADEIQPRIGRRFRRGPTLEEQRETARRAAWRHPLIEQISKDGFNLMAEFEASLQGEAYEDAFQTVTTAGSPAELGLLPWAKDPQLSLTFPTAVALAMQTHPGMRQTMQEKLAAPGLLRVRQAKLTGDVAALRAATVQLIGTQAASEAHHFLADRELAAGDFDAAVAHYRLAMAEAPADQCKTISAMLRLAGAMAGRDLGEKPREPIDFGGTRLDPDEFEQLVTSHRGGRGRQAAPVTVWDGRAGGNVPLPSRFELRPFADWQLRARDVHSPGGVDWAGRQFSVCFDADTMYVYERDQLKALNLADGRERWASRSGDMGFHPQWSGVAFRPSLADGCVFARRFYDAGGQVFCFKAAGGSVRWPEQPQERRFASKEQGGRLMSDPLAIGGSLYIFTVIDQSDNALELRLLALDPATGETRRSHPLLRLRPHEHWATRAPCNAVAVDDRIIATIGGCVLCCDTSGQALWVRKQTLLPRSLPDVSSASLAQPQEPPLVLGDRVFVTQRDVRAVECLDRHTGRLIWRYTSVNAHRLAGVAGDTVVIETTGGTTSGFVGLHAQTGEPRWHRGIEHLLEARLCGAEEAGGARLIYARRQQTSGNQWRPSLVWLDVETGRDLAVRHLLELTSREPLLGPLVVHGKRIWLFSGENPLDARRRIWELVPPGAPLAPPEGMPEDSTLAFWLPDSPGPEDSSLRTDVAAGLGWTLLSSRSDRQTGWQAKWQNKPDVVITLAEPASSVRMLRRVSVPKTGSCRLVIQVGCDGGERYALEVTAAGKAIFSGEVFAKTAPGGWLRREVDLTSFAGQTVWLSATARALDGKPAHPAWAVLDVVSATK